MKKKPIVPPSKNPKKIKYFFNSIYKNYDLINNITSFGVTPYWRVRINRIFDKVLFKNAKILDIATGTGTSIKGLIKKNVSITGVDISENMLKIAKKKYPSAKFIEASVYNLPFKDNSFDIVTSSFSIRNFDKLDIALNEMYRVLKPNGKLIIAEFSIPEPKIFRKLYYFYISKFLPKIAKIINKTANPFEYFVHSVMTWKKPDVLSNDIKNANFINVYYKFLTNGIVALHFGKKSMAHPTSKPQIIVSLP